ncbi:MAG: DsbA family protein [Kineosporiaceae bacterium]
MDDAPTARPTVVYGNDALCGWCFATGPAILEAKQELGDEVAWRIETGGLVVGERVRPVAMDREYLVAGLAQVAMVSGRRAGEAYYERILGTGTWVSNSEPTCRAVLVAQEMGPDVAVEFSHWLTDALYLDGRVPDDPDTLRDAAAAHGVDGHELLARWATPGAVETTREAFQRARALGVQTYPSLFLEAGDGTLDPLVTGYTDARTIVRIVREAVARPAVLPG